MAKVIQIDWLAEELLSVFESLGFDMPYIESKRHEFKNKDRFKVLLSFNNLDNRCLSALAERLNIDIDAFKITLETITKL